MEDMNIFDTVDANVLDYRLFCTKYMEKNQPVRILNIMNKWFSRALEWRSPIDNNCINYDLLKEKYGNALAPIVDGNSVSYGSEERCEMKVGEYLMLMEKKEAGKRYLKDWHFAESFPDMADSLYTTPIFFQDDWLNWWCKHKGKSTDDFRFVYIGPAGSWTPMHHDVYRSYSWSVNIVGVKEWIFFRPEDEWKLKDKFNRYVIPDVTADNIDTQQFPYVHEATAIKVIQGPGEAIFVPSGWYHQVLNVCDTISINHNWLNGYNLMEVWEFIQNEYKAVYNELEHLRDIGMTETELAEKCQEVMAANTGMNQLEFQDFLKAKLEHINQSIRNLEQLTNTNFELLTHKKDQQMVRKILAQLDEQLNSTETLVTNQL